MLRISEVAKRLGVSNRTVLNWINDGKVRAYRAGKRCMWLIDEDDLEKAFRPNVTPDIKISDT